MSLTPIPDFHELKLPHKDGGREHEWCTFASQSGMLYLLNGGRFQLCDLMDIVGKTGAEIHFDSEAECHNAAYIYYRQHNKQYPYAEEWRNSLSGYRLNTQAVTASVESEPMTFK